LQIFAAKSHFLKSTVVASLENLESFKAGYRYIHVQTLRFDSYVKRMTVVYQDLQTRENVAFMKGAPERVLDACAYDTEGKPFTKDSKNEILQLMDRFASEGLVISHDYGS
jgi:magnesium-transporting ATPase (P-type)